MWTSTFEALLLPVVSNPLQLRLAMTLGVYLPGEVLSGTLEKQIDGLLEVGVEVGGAEEDVPEA
jgi:hypothetical protein